MRALMLSVVWAGFVLAGIARADDPGFGSTSGPAEARSFRLGSLELIALHDAQFVMHNDGKVFGVDAGPAAVAEVLRAAGQPDDRITVSVSALLVRSGKRLVLLDSGLGAKAGGALQASLKAAGVAPDAITDVVITHSHFDHVGGLATENGTLAFPNAKIRMTAAEWTYMKGRAESAGLVKIIDGHVEPFTVGKPIAPGIFPVALDGHTPGHVGYEVVSGKAKLLDVGDMVHSFVISLARPGWTVGFDTDSAAAKATRIATLSRLAKDHELMFAPHFPFPGVGRVAGDGTEFHWVPDVP